MTRNELERNNANSTMVGKGSHCCRKAEKNIQHWQSPSLGSGFLFKGGRSGGSLRRRALEIMPTRDRLPTELGKEEISSIRDVDKKPLNEKALFKKGILSMRRGEKGTDSKYKWGNYFLKIKLLEEEGRLP